MSKSITILPNGGYEFQTAKATYVAHRRTKRFNPTMLVCNVRITNCKYQSKSARVNLDLFDDTNIKSKSEVLSDALEINANTLETELKLLAIGLEDILNQPEAVEHVVIDEEEAKKLLKNKGLIASIQDVLGLKVAGEEKTRLLLFLVAVSYKSQRPLHSILSATSSSGKSYLMEKAVELLPQEDVITYTVMTRSSIPNLQHNELQNKCIVIEDLTGIDKQAEFHLREIQTKGSLAVSKYSQEYGETRRKVIEAHCSTLSATTREKVYRDNENRSFFLKLDESDEQTGRVLDFKSQMKSGGIDEISYQEAVGQIRNAVRYLKPLEVLNPFASSIKIPEQCKDRRRLQDLFFGLIDVITFLHQLQRKKEDGRLIATKEDVELALELTLDMFIIKSDDLSNSNRKFLEDLKEVLKEKSDDELTEIHFKADELLGKIAGGNSTIYRKVKALQKEGVLIQVSGNQRVGIKYRLLFDDDYEAKKALIQEELLSGLKSK